ncbi:MAG: NADH-quinone oxidoreductase subunit L [Actinomycetota bacterium]
MTGSDLLILAIPGSSLLATVLATADRLMGGRFLGRHLARTTVWGVGLSAAAAAAAAVLAFADPAARTAVVGRWIDVGPVGADVAFLLDPLSGTMAVTVAGLSWLVARFSVNYLHNEEGFGRYFTVLPLFVSSMLVLVLAENFLLLFVAWEVVGACSYLLISFYRDRPAAAEAGTRAFVLNRLGDAGLLVGLFLLVAHAGGLGYGEALSARLTPGVATAIGLCLLAGATGKSAQVPLAGWLARAMEGPTPSSALIHGATMVTAGVYLIVRSAPIFEQAPVALAAVGVVGAATALYGQLTGLTQVDIKGMLAASTNAHLGVMLMLCGLGLYPVAIFHLVAHAFYKTNLFLTAPSILHHLHGGPAPGEEWVPNGSARAAAVLFGLVAVAVAILPVAGVEIVSGPGAHGMTLVLALGAVAAFALWFSTARIVAVAFHDPAGRARRGAQAAAVVLALVGAGALLRILPGGLKGSWFASLLSPTVRVSDAPSEAATPAMVTVVIVLLCFAASGLVVARLFDRFRPERTAGTWSRPARRLYAAAANRMLLDEMVQGAGGLTMRAGIVIDRFDRRVLDPLTGAFLPETRPAPAQSWETRLRAHLADHPRPDRAAPELQWLFAPAPGEAAAPSPGPVAQMRRGVRAMAGGAENAVASPSAGLYGSVTTALATFTGAVERAVFQHGVESVLERFTRVLAGITETAERAVFQLGPERVVGGAGSGLRRSFLRLESLLARPMVAGAAAVLLIALAAGQLS